jgi:hypothetical protein
MYHLRQHNYCDVSPETKKYGKEENFSTNFAKQRLCVCHIREKDNILQTMLPLRPGMSVSTWKFSRDRTEMDCLAK